MANKDKKTPKFIQPIRRLPLWLLTRSNNTPPDPPEGSFPYTLPLILS